MYIEGKNAIKQAIESNITINKVMVDKNFQGRKDEIINLAVQKKIKFEFVPRVVLDKKSKTKHHQGYIAESVDFDYSSVEDILNVATEKKSNSFIVLLDGIEDPHNFGAIIRSCECAGVDGIIIPKDRSVEVNATVIKTSVGTVDDIPISMVTNLNQTIKDLKEKGFWVVGTDMDGTDYRELDYKGKIALVIGNEGKGMSDIIRKSCDFIAKIPMYGKVNSLNASVASGIMIYEVVRQKR